MLRPYKSINRLLKTYQSTLINNAKYSSRAQTQTTDVADADVDDDMPVKMKNPFHPQAKRCLLCGVRVDYKNVQLLSQFVSSVTGVPLTQKNSGLCEKKYKDIIKKIRISRNNGFMAHRSKESTFFDDPDLTNRSMYSRRKRDSSEKGILISGKASTKSSNISDSKESWEQDEILLVNNEEDVVMDDSALAGSDASEKKFESRQNNKR